jgi:hypothetical protein
MAGRPLTDFERRQLVYVRNAETAGLERQMAVIISSISRLHPMNTFQKAGAAMQAYLGPGVVLSPSNLQQKTVQIAPLPPDAIVAPIMESAQAQAVADAEADRRTQAAAAALQARGLETHRVLSLLASDPAYHRGLDQMVNDIAQLVPAPGLNAAGAPLPLWGQELGADGKPLPGGRTATEAEAKALIRAILETCTSQSSHRVASWMQEYLEASAIVSALLKEEAKAAQDRTQAHLKWTDEDVTKLQAGFNSDPKMGGWKIPNYFLLRVRDFRQLAPLILKGVMPVTAATLPARCKPHCLVGDNRILQYEEKKMQKVTEDGAVVWMDLEEAPASPTKTPTKTQTFEETRRWGYSVLALARGMEIGGRPWCTVQAFLTWLEVISVVQCLPDVTADGFVDYRDASLSEIASLVNQRGYTLTEAYLSEVTKFEANINQMRQHRSLLGSAAGDSAASAANTPAKVANAGGGGACPQCGVKAGELKQLASQLQQQKNLVANKQVIIDKHKSVHGPLPQDAWDAIKAGGNGAASSPVGSGTKRARGPKKK